MTSAIRRSMPLLTALIVAVLGLLTWWHITLGFSAFTWEAYRRIQVEHRPVPVPTVDLQADHGGLFSLDDLRNKVVVVNFIYSRCRTLCRYSGTVYARLLTALSANNWQDRVQLISISLEPAYDTPMRLMDYKSRYRSRTATNWIVARALSQADQQFLLSTFGVVSIPDEFGGIQHNAAIHIIDHDGQLVRIVDDTRLENIMTAINQVMENHVAVMH